MAKVSPPQHRVDAKPVLIPRTDPAWDHDRIDQEKESLEDPSEHPVEQYWAGDTRYDLEATHSMLGRTVQITDYLKDGVQPTRIHLRRIPSREHGRLMYAAFSSTEARQQWDAFYDACRLTVKAIENGPEITPRKNQPLSEADMDRLYAAGLVGPVGVAGLLASAPLSTTESERYGS